MSPGALRSMLSRALGRTRRGDPPEGLAAAGFADGLEEADRAALETVPAADRRTLEEALPHTMTGFHRLLALIDAVRYSVRGEIPGAFAECGVWRGGSVLAMIRTLQELGVEDREIWLYDTFEGMTRPTESDVSSFNPPAKDLWRAAQLEGGRMQAELFGAEAFDEDTVRKTIHSTGYPADRLHFVKGPVESTLPNNAPENIALLRLDTDWYESTRHELLHLYPRLSAGGVLIIDDYGHWEGCRRAVDEYFGDTATPILLSRIDYTGRIGIKH